MLIQGLLKIFKRFIEEAVLSLVNNNNNYYIQTFLVRSNVSYIDTFY